MQAGGSNASRVRIGSICSHDPRSNELSLRTWGRCNKILSVLVGTVALGGRAKENTLEASGPPQRAARDARTLHFPILPVHANQLEKLTQVPTTL